MARRIIKYIDKKLAVSLLICFIVVSCQEKKLMRDSELVFPSEAWKSDERGCKKGRTRYETNILRNKKLYSGADSLSVKKLFGEPDVRQEGNPYIEFKYITNCCNPNDPIGLKHAEFLVVRLEKNKVVSISSWVP